MFSTDTDKVEGISATKALALASGLGQKIYTIDLSNVDQLINITIDNDAYNEIRNAIYSGKTVTVHETPLNYAGWSGSGYIVTDDLGAGAYKISGGSNGGEVNLENATGPVSTLIKVISFLQSFAELLNDIGGGPLSPFIKPLGKIFTVLGTLSSLVNISTLDGCSAGDIEFLVLITTFAVMFMLLLAAFAPLLFLAFGPILFLIMAFIFVIIIDLILGEILGLLQVRYTTCR